MGSNSKGDYYMRRAARELLKQIGSRDLSQVYGCVNALQKTAFRINTNVLGILDNVWENNIPIDGLVSREKIEKEPYPFDVEPFELNRLQKEELKVWRARQNKIYQTNARNLSKQLQIERTLQQAKDFAKYDKFYFVTQCDFRSRMYQKSDFMNPQTADYGKATLEFAYGVEIKEKEDAKWLAVHGANCFGEDKISLNDREQWAYDNEDNIVKTVEGVLDHSWWMSADKPFQFLAFCTEFYGYLKEGKGFVTHLPVSADGSCNGLQHLSAILRDEKGGEAVNLMPSNVPNDIYSDVAEDAKIRIEADAKDGKELAKQLLEFGINRKLTKKPTMVIPYSGTRYACRLYIQQEIEDRIEKGQQVSFDPFDAAVYLVNHVWDSINSTISSASSVMDFIKDIGKAYAEKQVPMEWITPTNFHVIQNYPDLEKRRIKSHLDGSIISLVYKEPIDNTVSKSQTLKGASPNFIHSMDASALIKTVNRCMDEGITQFAMVHDSYGTHSPDLPKMQQIIRDEFRCLYEENDVLGDLRDHAITTLGHDNLPDVPSRGNLDLKQVLKSDYFFA